MTVDPTTSRKHTVTIVEKAMIEIGYNVRADRPAKAQALELIKRLGEEGSPLAVRRVRMRVRVTMPGKDAKRLKEKVMEEVEEVEEEETGAEWEAASLIYLPAEDGESVLMRFCTDCAYQSGVVSDADGSGE